MQNIFLVLWYLCAGFLQSRYSQYSVRRHSDTCQLHFTDPVLRIKSIPISSMQQIILQPMFFCCLVFSACANQSLFIVQHFLQFNLTNAATTKQMRICDLQLLQCIFTCKCTVTLGPYRAAYRSAILNIDLDTVNYGYCFFFF